MQMTRSLTTRTSRSAGSAVLYPGLTPRKNKKREEHEYELEYILKTHRIPFCQKGFPKNIRMAEAKFKGYDEPYFIEDFSGCMEALKKCYEREDALELFAESIKENLKKKKQEDLLRLASQPSTSSAPPQAIDDSLYDFDLVYPGYKTKDKYEGEENNWKIVARTKEEEWNDKMEEKGIAPVYIVNWINQEATREFELITEPIISKELKDLRKKFRSELDKKEMDEIDAKPYCQCIGKCKPSCECMYYAEDGRPKILLNSDGTIDEAALVHNFNNSMILCGEECKCSSSCPYKKRPNRLFPLVIFYTGITKGYGAFAADQIPGGSYIGIYTGKVCLDRWHKNRDSTYNFDLVLSDELALYLDQKNMVAGIPYIDALKRGSICRFLNNACGNWANSVTIDVYTNDNRAWNDIMFFTRRKIERGEELTIEYCLEKPIGGKKCGCHPDCKNTM